MTTVKFTDTIDKNILESTVAEASSGLIFDSTDVRTHEGATVFLNHNQLRTLRDQINDVIEEKPVAHILAKDPDAEKDNNEKLAADMNEILDLFRDNPLITKGQYVLVDGNAVRVMEGLKKVLTGGE